MNPSTAKELIEINVKLKLLARAILENNREGRINPYLIEDLEGML